VSKIIFPIVIFVLMVFFIYRTLNNNKDAEKNKAIGQIFLEQNAEKEGVVTTTSGLQYEVIQEGSGLEHPTQNSRVKVHYRGSLIDGTVFDSSIDRGEPITFGLNQVIKGWQEGVQLMVKGQKIRLFVPSSLGYGKKRTGSIPPASVLIFEVELLEIL